MNEINFFEDNKKKLDINFDSFDFKYKAYILPIVVILILLVFIILNFTTSNKISNLENKKDNLQMQIDKFTEEKNNAGLLLSENEEIKLKQYSLNLIEKADNINSVSTSILETVKTSIPSSLFLSSLEINDGQLIITGYAKSTNIIAKFQNNLSKSDLFNDVFVSDITNDLGNYNFTLSAKVRG